MKYLIHFGKRVYLADNRGMTLHIDEARVFLTEREAREELKVIMQPPHHIPTRRGCEPFVEVCRIG